MLPDDVRISNLHLHSFIIPNIAEAYSVPLRWEQKQNMIPPLITRDHFLIRLHLSLCETHFVGCKTRVILLQCPLGVLEGLKDQLFLALSVCVGQQGQVAGRPGQPPQELCVIAAWKQTSGISWNLLTLVCLTVKPVRNEQEDVSVCPGLGSPVLVLQQQQIKLLRLCTAVQIISLLQNRLYMNTNTPKQSPKPLITTHHRLVHKTGGGRGLGVRNWKLDISFYVNKTKSIFWLYLVLQRRPQVTPAP